MTGTSNDSKENVIIIGSGVAGMNVIYNLLKTENNFDLMCITQEDQYAYSTCGLPYAIEGVTEKYEDIILHKPEFFAENNVKILSDTTVTDLDLQNKQIKTVTSEKKVDYFRYDYLVFATGRTPFIPPIKGIELKNVYTLMTYEDGKKIVESIPHCSRAVVIGAGYIGLEMAMAFLANNIDTTVVELAPSVLPATLDPDMGKLVEKWLVNKGIQIIAGKKVWQLKGNGGVKAAILEDGMELPADIIMLTTGIRPNVELAKRAGIDIGLTGGIKTDENQRVYASGERVENIFALGDCIETMNLITNRPMISALASSAILQSRIVANNILGKKSEYKGTINPSVTYLGGLQVGSVGLTSENAEKAGISYRSATAIGISQSRYIPGWKDITFKILAHKNYIIGAQIISEKDVKERINALTLAIREKITINTILNTERCYTPPLALLSDPMFKALEKLIE
ncbi:MAG: NAD(P)/FAD-dependent oxidoreductase [Candidatus Helarchaeota archaeon]